VPVGDRRPKSACAPRDAPARDARASPNRAAAPRRHLGHAAATHIDSHRSAWLIKRFCDQEAKLRLPTGPNAARKGIPFDVLGADFGHHGEDCTFETFKRFGIRIDGSRRSPRSCTRPTCTTASSPVTRPRGWTWRSTASSRPRRRTRVARARDGDLDGSIRC